MINAGLSRKRYRVVLSGLAGVLAVVALAGCSDSSDSSASVSGDPAVEDGGAPDGRELTPFDTQYPAVGKLDPALLHAVQQAAADARDRVEFLISSGWRSQAYQQRLLDEGVEKYGSLEKARRFVSTPEKSEHVSGKAVDIGPTRADDWLIQHGARYGLCQVYSNEMWHFELLTTPGGDCPAKLPDAAG
ncbi:M15 family metallopeptidase [Amycolatopsis sp. NBC_00345]|uniref:M15 family metallopeptidase n=1 Tax=Amycolatopsis sp. NBC_00345 TaxID=2975955 RepID=UPI002E25ED8F